MIAEPVSSLKGHLRMVAGGQQIGLPLGRVVRVALASAGRRLPPRVGAEAWWRGSVLEGRRGVPVVGLAGLIGLRAGTGGALVYCRIEGGQVALECEEVRGIVPATVTADRLPPAWFQRGRNCFSRVLRTPGAPVLELVPEELFPPRRRQAIRQFMTESEPSIEKLWELSELESKLALAPTAAGYRELAARYSAEGWQEDAARVAAKAGELTQAEATETPRAATGTASYSGAFNPRVLIELLHVLHLTGKSGELRLTEPGGAEACFNFAAGRIAGAESSDAHPGEEALRRSLGLKGGRYEFFPGTSGANCAGALSDTAAVLARLTEGLQ